MRKIILLLGFFLLTFGCKSIKPDKVNDVDVTDFTIAFGSCNKNTIDNLLWDDVLSANPDVWIWGGDIVYADTDDMSKLKATYDAQNKVAGYKQVKNKMPVIGTWDDHDYGLNDGGVEFAAKKQSQQQFLDFMDVSQESPRRKQEGVYTTHDYILKNGTVRVLVLDTRYFRTAITPDNETQKRLKPNTYGDGTVLGEQQWQWLRKELTTSTADFNVLVSSIQFLSNEHGFECWGNFPHEVDRLKKLVTDSNAKGVMILSGDRHISEFSSVEAKGLKYPLIDFTSSGLTHAYSKFEGEANPFRVGEVVSTESFGIVKFNFEKKQVFFEMLGDEGKVLGELQQDY